MQTVDFVVAAAAELLAWNVTMLREHFHYLHWHLMPVGDDAADKQ